MRKKVKFPYIIIIVLFSLLATVGIIGGFTYRTFTQVMNDAQLNGPTDIRIVLSKKFLTKLSRAENSVKSYSLTKDSIYLNKFYVTVEDSYRILEKFKSKFDTNDTKVDFTVLDSLTDKKIDILSDLLILQDNYRVDIALDKVVNNIEGIIVDAKADSEEDTKKKKGFFRRLFRRKKDQREKIKKEKVAFSKIDDEVKTVKVEEGAINKNQVNQELELIRQDKEVTDKIQAIINDFEIQENLVVTELAKQSAVKIKRTNRQIAIFCILAGILVLFISYLIIRYIITNNRYRKALRKAKREAEDLAFTKERFLNNMSHEIRTPMNAISGFIDELADSPLNDGQRSQVNMIQKSCNHLLHIIDEVLTFTKLQHNKAKLDFSGFKVHELIEDIKNILNPLAEEKSIDLNITFSKDLPQILIGDSHRLSQILMNVTGNAIKFTNEGEVNIHVVSKKMDDNKLEVSFIIEDTGIGMSKNQIKKVFDEFEQAEVSTTRNYGGTGLGLSITKMLVELYNGSIDVKSKKGEGTTVNITIPFEVGENKDVVKVKNSNGYKLKKKSLKILIVDDEPYNRILLKTILEKNHIKTKEAENGRDAIDKLKKDNFDLILMDSRMPIMNGIDATKIIRRSQNAKIREIPIIALSAAVQEQDQLEYKAAGMNGFLSKPYKAEQLISKINELFDNDKDNAAPIATDHKNGEKKIDFSHLEELSDGDKEFYYDMLQTFVVGLKECVESLSEQKKVMEYNTIANDAHKMASPAGHLSANKLYTLLKSIEDEARGNKNDDLIIRLITQFEEETIEVLELVNQELNKTNGN